MSGDNVTIIYQLALALALGLVIGIEREWRDEDGHAGKRPAGIRSFGLIGLSGGLAALISEQSAAMLPVGLAVTFAVLTLAFWKQAKSNRFKGVTTIFTGSVAYSCGAMSVLGFEVPAISAAVVVAMILSAKERLHGFVHQLDQREIFAALQFILIAGVILPLIPNENMGPFNALNPFEIWALAVLISGLSFLGYVGLKALSPRRGILGIAVLGGFVSSTAVSISLARLARRQPDLHNLLSVGIITASTIMFVRVAAIVFIFSQSLFWVLALPIATVIAVSVIGGLYISSRSEERFFEKPDISNPLDITSALIFAAILGLVMVGSRALESIFGAQGVYAISLASGLADVDAITLTLSRFPTEDLATNVAATGIFLAAITNTVVKVALAGFAGGRTLRPAFATLSIAILAGSVVATFALGP